MRVLALVSGELDSPIAAYLLSQRGMEVDFIHFDAQPYNEGILLYKTKKVFEIFKRNGWVNKLYVVNQKYLLDVLVENVPSNMIIVLWRRFMMRIAEFLSEKYNYDFLATGDSLGQVASQTLYNLYVIDQATKMYVLRPLLLWNKKDIISLNHKLGIYDITSIKSSCILGMPSKSKTNITLDEVVELEKGLDVQTLVNESEFHVKIFDR